MILHVSLACLPSTHRPEAVPVRELVLDCASLGTGTRLRDELAASGAAGPFTVAGRPLEGLTPGTPPLVNGAVILCGAPAPAPSPGAGPALLFVVSAGPDAGQLIPLTRGSYWIGRCGTDIVIRDSLLSRRHALLTVESDRVTLRDNHSANGTRVDGRLITETVLTADSAIRLGAGACRLAFLFPAPGTPSAVAASRSLLQEEWAGKGTGPVPVELPAPPPRSRALLLAAFLPLGLGVALALATGMWFFLAFSALSAVTASLPWLSGQRRAASFNTAVAEAAARNAALRRRAAPDPGRIALAAAAGAGPLRAREPAGAREICVRIGTADQPADLAVTGAPPQWKPPVLPGAPLVLVLPGTFPAAPAGTGTGVPGTGQDHPPSGPPLEVTFAGPVEEVSGAARAVLLQLGSFPTGPVPVVCWGSPDTLPLEARFLPGVHLASRRAVFESLLLDSAARVVLDFGPDPAPFQLRHRPSVLHFGAGPPTGTRVVLGPGTAVLHRAGSAIPFLPDLVGPLTFARLARALGGAAPSKQARRDRGIPRWCSLWSGDGPAGFPEEATTPARWAATDVRPGLRAPVGESSSGVLTFDLVSDGPHLLAAGTTGAGKSEFLRSFVLGVAANHSPRKVNFLLIDFKGGSGLETLAELPHVVGLLTDLSRESVSRALVSLRGELRRREVLFAEYSADSIEGFLRADPVASLPRLVVVIDEFRVLADEVPDAVEHLMRIASIGRSLGVHLVLATQRPQGAVTPDIRANVTAWAAFRVQSGLESSDLVGTAAASALPVRLPGRGLLRIGADEVVEFQAASCSGGGTETPGPALQDLGAFLSGSAPARPDLSVQRERSQRERSPQEGGQEEGEQQGLGAEREGPSGRASGIGAERAPGVQAAVRVLRAAAAGRYPAARRPVAPPLPEVIRPAPIPRSGHSESRAAITLGLQDLPGEQTQRPLLWSPPSDSHLAFIGPTSSESAGALGHLVTECLLQSPDTHLYILDGDFSLAFAAHAAQTGAYVQGHEVARAERVLERVASSVVERLAGAPAEPAPALVVISGWGRWAGAFRTRRFSTGEDALQDIARDGHAAGVHLVLTGERELTGSRFFPHLPNRVFLPLGASPETIPFWPRLPAIDPVPGRGLAEGRFSPGAVAQLITGRREQASAPRPPGLRPFRIEPLPTVVPPTALRPSPGTGGSCRIPIGLGGDELDTVFLGLGPGAVCAAVGPPRSGRTTFLNQVEGQAPLGLFTLRPAARAGPVDYWRAALSQGPLADDPARCLLVIDNAEALPPELHQLLAAAVSAGARAVLAAAPGFLSMQAPLARRARAADQGLVLAPRTPADGEVFGVRLEAGDAGRIPGRAVLLYPGGQTELQLALNTGTAAQAAPAPTGSSTPPSPGRYRQGPDG